MENLPTYRLTQSGPEAQDILDQVNLNTVDIEQLKRLYQALTQSEPEIIEPTDTWPVANPEENVIYRVIDRVNTPPQYYSDYMWNGTSMVPMAQYNNAIDNEPTANSSNLVKSGGVYSFVHANGGAYDISAAHAVGGVLATYDDLADALGTNGANVPAAVRKGGMSIKYVQSVDNKYVQWRYMGTSIADADFTNVANWQGVDEEVTAGSDNLIESGGVANLFNSQYGASPSDFAISDPNGNEIVQFRGGHIKTKEFDSSQTATTESAGLMSSEDKMQLGANTAKLSTIEEGAEMNDVFTQNSSKVDFSISDENDVNIVEFAEGQIKTKNFDSRNLNIEDGLYDFSISDGEGNEVMQIIGGRVKTKNFDSRDVLERLSALEEDDWKNIACIGDSLTAAYTSTGEAVWENALNTYYQEQKIRFINYGVGGEGSPTILGRVGVIPYVITEALTIPVTTTAVEVKFKSSWLDGEGNYRNARPLQQGNKGLNPVLIDNIEGTLSFSDNKFYFTRTEAGDSRNVPEGTIIITKSGISNPYGVIVWIGTNDGDTTTTQDLIDNVKKTLLKFGVVKYLVIGIYYWNYLQQTNWTLAMREEQEKILTAEFGDNFVNFRQYAISNAIADAVELGYLVPGVADGLVTGNEESFPTPTDVTQMAAGYVPQSLRRDNLHLNNAGNKIFAYYLRNKINHLNF